MENTPPTPPPPPPNRSDQSVGELVSDAAARTSTLVREEIELAKAEISEKVNELIRGSVIAIVAGVFLFFALILIMEGFAWLLNEEVFDNAWAGFFVEAVIFLLIAAGAGFFAYRSVKAGAPPVPEQAIEEAKLIRTAFEGEEKASPSSGAPKKCAPIRSRPDPRPPVRPVGRRRRSAATSMPSARTSAARSSSFAPRSPS